MRLMSVPKTFALAIGAVVALFAVFPLTDTDIWWHLACAREWVTTWTPVREPVANVHEYFQQTVALAYDVGGAPLLVAFKAVLWGVVFALFLWPSCNIADAQKKNAANSRINVIAQVAACVLLLFIFRYQFEIRPVLFSLLFLGMYWKVLPWLFDGGAWNGKRNIEKTVVAVVAILAVQWLWCKFQGLYILGPIFALIVLALQWWNSRGSGHQMARNLLLLRFAFVALLLAMPFFHHEGLNLFLYPFGLLDRLLGLSPSAAVFASEIAENRSPVTLLMAGENVLQSTLMVVLSVAGLVVGALRLRRPESVWLFMTAILALVAERNFVMFLPVFFAVGVKWLRSYQCKYGRDTQPLRLPNRLLPTSYFLLSTLLVAFIFGLWLRSVSNYDSMVAYQRVPVAAAEWMKSHPHPGHLFNDDRAGGYLAFVNPSDSTYIDGRFILKTAEFFEKYLQYAESPQTFVDDAETQNIDRVVLPLRYYARWGKLLTTLDSLENWHVAYRDSLFVVMDRTRF